MQAIATHADISDETPSGGACATNLCSAVPMKLKSGTSNGWVAKARRVQHPRLLAALASVLLLLAAGGWGLLRGAAYSAFRIAYYDWDPTGLMYAR